MLKVAVSAAAHCHVGQLWREHAMQHQPVTNVVILPPPPPEVGAKPIHPPDLLSGEDCDPSKEVLHRLQMSMCASNGEAQYKLELLPLLAILLKMQYPFDLLNCFVIKLASHCSTVHADYTVHCVLLHCTVQTVSFYPEWWMLMSSLWPRMLDLIDSQLPGGPKQLV